MKIGILVENATEQNEKQKQNEEQNEKQNENEELDNALALITFGAASLSHSLNSNHPLSQQKRKERYTDKYGPGIVLVTE